MKCKNFALTWLRVRVTLSRSSKKNRCPQIPEKTDTTTQQRPTTEEFVHFTQVNTTLERVLYVKTKRSSAEHTGTTVNSTSSCTRMSQSGSMSSLKWKNIRPSRSTQSMNPKPSFNDWTMPCNTARGKSKQQNIKHTCNSQIQLLKIFHEVTILNALSP